MLAVRESLFSSKVYLKIDRKFIEDKWQFKDKLKISGSLLKLNGSSRISGSHLFRKSAATHQRCIQKCQTAPKNVYKRSQKSGIPNFKRIWLPSINSDDDDVTRLNNFGIKTELKYEGWPKDSNGFSDFDKIFDFIGLSLKTSQYFCQKCSWTVSKNVRTKRAEIKIRSGSFEESSITLFSIPIFNWPAWTAFKISFISWPVFAQYWRSWILFNFFKDLKVYI